MCEKCNTTTSQPTPIGECYQCGGQMYEGLFHQCMTNVQPILRRIVYVPDANGILRSLDQTW